jgi:hypothetical protein
MTLWPFQVPEWLASMAGQARVDARITRGESPMSYKLSSPTSFKQRVAALRARAAQMSPAQSGGIPCAAQEPAELGWNDWKNQ